MEELLRPRAAQVEQDASFLRRAGAFLIDLLFIDLIVTAPFTEMFSAMLARAEHGAFTPTPGDLAAIVAVFLLIYGYLVVFEYTLGQTPGMTFLRIAVDGERPFGAIALRNSFILPFFPFIALWIIEPIAIIAWRRSVLEQLTKTRTRHQRTIIY
jgi:uncharacterized RDD family membrane protein YckC